MHRLSQIHPVKSRKAGTAEQLFNGVNTDDVDAMKIFNFMV